MTTKMLYVFIKTNQYGFDKIQVIAFSKEQADETLARLVKNPAEWHYKYGRQL